MIKALLPISLFLLFLGTAHASAAEPLLITNADVSNVTNTTALVSWQTNRESTSTATYGQSPCPCAQGVGDPPERMVTLHSVQLSGLTADRDYYVQPVSIDRDGVRADGPVLHFVALHDSSLPTPALTNVAASLGAVDNAVTVTWKTSISVRGGSGVEYATTPCPCAQNVQLDLGTGTDHRVEVPALAPSTMYFLRPFSYHPKDTATIQYGAQQTATTGNGTAARSTSTTIQLLFPNGGELWNQSELHLLSWKATPGFVNALKVALINEKGERTVLLSQLATEQRPSGNTALLLPSSLVSGTYALELANAANPDDRDLSDATIMIGTVAPPAPPTAVTPAPAPPPATQAPPTFSPAPTPTPPPAPSVKPPSPKTTPPSVKKAAAKPALKTVPVKKVVPKKKTKPAPKKALIR